MPAVANIEFSFESEEHAILAQRAAEALIKLIYAPGDLPWVSESREKNLAERYFEYGELAHPLDPMKANPYCCLARLRREGTKLTIDRCSDISGAIVFGYKNNFFSHLCFCVRASLSRLPLQRILAL